MVEAANWKNVNNWHWIEKDCTVWAHDLLKTKLLAASGPLRVLSIPFMEGEVSVNVRKGRIRQVFDISFELEFSSEPGEQKGRVRIADLMSDTAKTELEMFLVEGARNERLMNELRDLIWEAVVAMKTEIEAAQGRPLLVQQQQQQASQQADQQEIRVRPEEPAKEKMHEHKASDLHSEAIINAPAELVFQALTDPSLIAGWSRNTLKLSGPLEPGSSFTLFSGSIQCKLLSVKEKSLSMNWRLSSWPLTQVDSTVEINLVPQSSATRIVLKQVNVPAADLDNLSENWNRYYWEPIRVFLGCPSDINV